MRGQFAVLPLKWNCYLAVSSIKLHDTHLDTQLGAIDISIDIIKLEKGNKQNAFSNFIF